MTSSELSDSEWINLQLRRFVEDARPRVLGRGSIMESPTCGRIEALRQLETVKPILDRLYPGWRNENPRQRYFEFAGEVDAATKLLARLASAEEVERRLSGFDASPSISAAGMHPLVWEAARSQWGFGNHAEAVSAVARAVNASLQNRLGRKDVSEGDLIKQAFSDKEPEPGKPRLRFPDVGDDQTQGSMRQGVMQFGAGCFAAIRNPLAHLPDDQVDVDEQQALESLAAFSRFARWIDQATLVTAEASKTGDNSVAETA